MQTLTMATWLVTYRVEGNSTLGPWDDLRVTEVDMPASVGDADALSVAAETLWQAECARADHDAYPTHLSVLFAVCLEEDQ